MKRIGEHLVDEGVVSPEAVERALTIQDRTGSRIGEILQAEGIVSSYRFYKELAKFKGLEFINLEEYNVNKSVLIAEERDEYQEMQYIPFDTVDKVIYIATTKPDDEITEYLDKKYSKYKLFITSPFDILWCLQKRFDKEYSNFASEHLFDNIPFSSSKFVLDSFYSKFILIGSLLLLSYAMTNYGFRVAFLILMNVFFLSSLISKVIFFGVGFAYKNKLKQIPKLELEDKELPVYSILIPLYHEKKTTINKLIYSLRSLDYPNEKLDIKLICEINDADTISAIKELRPSSNYQIVKVPEGYPQTKPKACNYALNFCKGEFITIYDAEDNPEPQQLRKVIAKFYNPDSNVACVQARLNYYNRTENPLTQLFSIEYSSWFDFMLYGLQKLGLPIPLGGTSNHFRIKTLKTLYAWDPYNVTEDADLGVRLSLAGLKTEVVDSITLEEAPISLRAWANQRIRWIKGYFQTYLVHMRNPFLLLKNLGFTRFLGFFFFVGAPGLIYLSVPIVGVITIASLFTDVGLPPALVEFSYLNLEVTLVVNLLIGLHVIIENKWYSMILGAILFPVYWVLHCITSFGAAYELIKMPHHWNKTEHGVSKFVKDE